MKHVTYTSLVTKESDDLEWERVEQWEDYNTPSINIIFIMFFYILHHLRFDEASFVWPSSSAIV